MSVSNALSYATQAKQRAEDPKEAVRLFELAFQELCNAVRDLEDTVAALESRRR
jgi:hypothetical protein